ncbi:phosphoethanolamine transferase [Pseudoalteromonas sp. HM-SA03]|uniref:phosphoethanolamine transferase n=1 Tax=Pseudoalteromonas sp. HM-SA03 TaxID=2029678 RepID=UPI000BAE0633|nr:phosphoethanolamine--lipid A transferase [Pseudoalteromonas sp. HM-SA03]PAX99270.1 phosphoethanolamine transferase [Pseudoalteromonas sp. HM-SA03]
MYLPKAIDALSSKTLILITSLYFTLVLNSHMLLEYSHKILALEEPDYFVLITLPIVIFFLMVVVFSLFITRYTSPVISVLILFSSIVFYATKEYGIIFDSTMFQNFYETDVSEASTYFNLNSFISVSVLGVIPAVLFLLVSVNYKPFFVELKERVIIILVSLVVIFGIVFSLYQNYASFVRNNEQFKRSVIPTYYISSLVKFVNSEFFFEPLVYLSLGDDAVKKEPNSKNKPNLVVFVLGETARAANFEYNGYTRDTNRYTSQYDIIPFQNVSSCGTTTAVSVPCMFSHMERANYSGNRAKSSDNVIDILKKAGIDVTWIENNSGCKGVCDRVKTIKIPTSSKNKYCDGFYCLDIALLEKLEAELSSPLQNDKLVVMHMIGSHGPTYYKRYPEEFRKFTPDCPKSDIQNCTNDELVNTYDNTILYTDYILSETIKTLISLEGQYNLSMIYVSDHGESLGENGVYLHGIPYSIAPSEQVKVPMLFWMNKQFSEQNSLKPDCLVAATREFTYSHDNIFHSLLGLMNVQSIEYTEKLDLFKRCRS